MFLKIKRSEQWHNKLKSCYDALNIKMISTKIDVSTRWNSTSEMPAIAIKLKLALNALCANNLELSSLQISENDWTLFEKVQEILKYFRTLSISLGGEKYVILPLVVIGFNMLLDKIETKMLYLDNKEERTTLDENI